MKKTISQSDFTAAFHHAGRGEQFSHEALCLLFDYLEEIDEDYELDVIAICCEYAEDDWKTIANEYNAQSNPRAVASRVD